MEPRKVQIVLHVEEMKNAAIDMTKAGEERKENLSRLQAKREVLSTHEFSVNLPNSGLVRSILQATSMQ